jgi:hypothetical protein
VSRRQRRWQPTLGHRDEIAAIGLRSAATIAWRAVHIAAVNELWGVHTFGPATATLDLEIPGHAVATPMGVLHVAHHAINLSVQREPAAAARE